MIPLSQYTFYALQLSSTALPPRSTPRMARQPTVVRLSVRVSPRPFRNLSIPKKIRPSSHSSQARPDIDFPAQPTSLGPPHATKMLLRPKRSESHTPAETGNPALHFHWNPSFLAFYERNTKTLKEGKLERFPHPFVDGRGSRVTARRLHHCFVPFVLFSTRYPQNECKSFPVFYARSSSAASRINSGESPPLRTRRGPLKHLTSVLRRETARTSPVFDQRLVSNTA